MFSFSNFSCRHIELIFTLSHSPKKQPSPLSPGVPAVVFLPQLNSHGIHPVWHMAQKMFQLLGVGHGRFGVSENGEAKGSPPGIPDDWCLINLITYPLSTATKRGAIIATSFCDVSSTCGLRGRINSYLSRWFLMISTTPFPPKQCFKQTKTNKECLYIKTWFFLDDFFIFVVRHLILHMKTIYSTTAAKFQTQRTLGAGGFDIDTAGRGGLTQHQVSHEKTKKWWVL